MRFSKRSEVEEFVRGRSKEDHQRRSDLKRSMFKGQCYLHGHQWMYYAQNNLGRNGQRLRRLLTDVGADSRRLRVVTNRTNRFLAKVQASTHPMKLDLNCQSYDGRYGATAQREADLCEIATLAAAKCSSFLRAAQEANANRVIGGQWVVGLRQEMGSRSVNGQDMADVKTRAYQAPAYKLTLDPYNTARDLRDHEEIVFSEVATVQKIVREYGEGVLKGVDKDKLKTVGMLTPEEQEFFDLSRGALYGHYRAHSKTKGAIVHQVHVKDDRGMFTEMYVAIDFGDGQFKLIDGEHESPFGGDGLPLVQIRGHHGGDGAIDLSDFDFLKDDQDKLNLAQTYLYRALQLNSYRNWLVNRKAFGSAASEEDIRGKFNNNMGGVIIYDTPMSQRAMPPQSVTAPQLPPWANDLSAISESGMREQSFRAEGNFGATKSHVPDASFQRALNEADQVHAIRVNDDVQRYEELLTVLLGTTIKNAKDRSPSTLATLSLAGFDGDDFADFLQFDHERPPAQVKIREGTVRHRSYAAKRQDLDNAMMNQGIRPESYREALAQMDSPLTESDRESRFFARRAAQKVLEGEPFEPMNLGIEAGEMLLTALRSALMSREAQADPQKKAMLQEAIALQEQVTFPPDPAQQEAATAPIPDESTPEELLGLSLGEQFA